MPKEITHWTLAAVLAENLPETSLFYRPIHTFSNLFFLGAIAPDIPFYYLAGPKTPFIQGLGVRFHGKDNRALGPVLAFLDKHQDPAALAFAAGVICHILTDTSFHPLVYYFAGKEGIHTGAVARHRQFETAMDLHFSSLYRPRVSLARLVRNLEVSPQRRNSLMGSLFGVKTFGEERCLGLSLLFHLVLQALFRSAMVFQIFDFLEKNTPWVPARARGLIYPCKRRVNLPFFRQEFEYKDPCTGDAVSKGIQTLAGETALAGKTLLEVLSKALAQGKPATGLMDDPDLPLIRPDLSAEGFRFWSGKKDLEKALYRGVDHRCLPLRNRSDYDR